MPFIAQLALIILGCWAAGAGLFALAATELARNVTHYRATQTGIEVTRG